MKRMELKLLNETATKHLDNLSIIQQNLSADDDDKLIVWQVVSVGETPTPIVFSDSLDIHVSDEFGNRSAILTAGPGQAFEYIQIDMDNRLVPLDQPSAFLAETEIHNKLEYGDISAHVFKEGKLLAVKPKLEPWQCAYYSFRPRFWIGILPGYAEGDQIELKEVKKYCTELSFEAFDCAEIMIRDAAIFGSGPVFEIREVHLPISDASYNHAI